MASSRSEENVNLKHFQHIMVSQCWWVLQFYGLIFLKFVLADVIANDFGQLSFVYGRCYCHVALFCDGCYTTCRCCNLFYTVVVMLLPPGCCCSLLFCIYWQMLLPYLFCDWWYCHNFGLCCAKWCTTVVVVAFWQMLLPKWLMVLSLFVFGRCYCQVAVVVATTVYSSSWQMLLPWWLMECLPWVWMADVITKVADGIATGSMF